MNENYGGTAVIIRSVLVGTIGVACVLLVGCASPTFNYQPTATPISEPPLGVVSTAMIGDRILVQGNYEEQAAIRLSTEVTVGLVGNYTFSPGTYVKKGQNSDGEFYEPSGLSDTGHVQKGAITDPFQAMLLESDGSLCGVSVFGGKVCTSNAPLKRITLPVLTADSFQQTLLYNGKVGNKINVAYREFTGNLARPAFNNEVEYDLAQSNVIGYKSARIEVIEATNQYIKYIVRQNFNEATH